ncbi:MAG: AAA family ATPase [Actinomycetota bacterium]
MKSTALESARRDGHRILDEVEKVIVGKRAVLEQVLIGILARGHVLMEDLPGLAKTLIARSFADAVGMRFKRIQFTPDLLPADITGSYIYDQRKAIFEFRRGPVFANLLLGDEINRAPPKTQAALLEAMQERQVTVEDKTFVLDLPFIVIATQNPIEHEGTYPLPEAQLDRFMIRIAVGYPSADQEAEMLDRRMARETDDVGLEQVVDGRRLIEMQSCLELIHLDAAMVRYIVDIVRATRVSQDVQVGASPRGTLAVMQLARGRALMDERDFVTPEDVKAVAVVGLAHRLTLRPELWVRRVSGEDVMKTILDQVATPRAEDVIPTV